MQGIFNIKLIEGNFEKLECDPMRLKKELAKLERRIPMECQLLYDEQNTKLVVFSEMLYATRSNAQIIQQYTLYDSRQIISQYMDHKNRYFNLDKQFQALYKENTTNKQKIAELQTTIDQQAKEFQQNFQQKGQETSQIVTDLNKKMNQLKQEHQKQFDHLNSEKYKRETELTNDINVLNDQKTKMQTIINNQVDEIKQLKIKITESENTIKQLNKKMADLNLFYSTQQQKDKEANDMLTQTIQQQASQFQNYINELQQQFGLIQAQSNQEKETLQLKHKQDIESLTKKYNLLKKDKEQLEEDKSQLNKDLSNQKFTLQATQKKLESLQAQNKILEEDNENYIRKGTNESQVIQKKDQEIKKLKMEINQLNINLQNEKELFEGQRTQNVALQQEKLQQTNQFEEEINKLNEEITIQAATIGTQKTQIENQQKQISSQSFQLKNSQEENKKLLTKISELNIQIEEFSTKGDDKDNRLRELQQQNRSKDQEIELLNQSSREQVNKYQTLNLQYNDSQGKLRQLQIQLSTLTSALENSRLNEKESAEANKKLIEDFTKSTQEEQEKIKAEMDFKDLIIKKVCLNQQDKYFDKVIGPMEKIMNSEFKINNFINDPNSQRDVTEYIVYEISFDRIKANNLLKEQKWICLDECLQFTSHGSIKATRSIQPNVDVTFVKGYIISIDEAQTPDLKGKKFLRKEYKSQSSPMLKTKEEAGLLSMNNLFCKLLLDKFNQLLGSPKINGKDILLQRQFVFQLKGIIIQIIIRQGRILLL